MVGMTMSNVCPNQRRELYTLHGSVMVTDTNASAKRKFSETESDKCEPDSGLNNSDLSLTPRFQKSLWTSQEDDLLRRLVSSYGNDEIQWQCIAEAFGGTRSAKRCRERWVEYINPSLSNDPFSKEEDGLILAYQSVHGNKWKRIAQLIAPGKRSATAIKSRWRQLQSQGYVIPPTYSSEQSATPSTSFKLLYIPPSLPATPAAAWLYFIQCYPTIAECVQDNDVLRI